MSRDSFMTAMNKVSRSWNTGPKGPYRHDHHSGDVARYFCTGVTLRYRGPVLEQAVNGNGTRVDWVWFGGYTRSPAAVTGPHLDGGKSPGWTMPTWAKAVAPLARVTV